MFRSTTPTSTTLLFWCKEYSSRRSFFKNNSFHDNQSRWLSTRTSTTGLAAAEFFNNRGREASSAFQTDVLYDMSCPSGCGNNPATTSLYKVDAFVPPRPATFTISSISQTIRMTGHRGPLFFMANAAGATAAASTNATAIGTLESFSLHQYRHHTTTIANKNSTGTNAKDKKGKKNPSVIATRTAGNHAVKDYYPSSPPPRAFIPRKAPLDLTPRAREFLKSILSKAPSSVHGIMLRYQPSTLQGQMRMVFSFDFIQENQKISVDDEEVSLELLPDGSPKPPNLSYGDGMKKLYVHSSAFMKVLGATMDIELGDNGDFTPTFHDREGNVLDPNA
jgi:hypothetical protein